MLEPRCRAFNAHVRHIQAARDVSRESIVAIHENGPDEAVMMSGGFALGDDHGLASF